MFTGKNDSALVGQYIQWKGQHKIAGWNSKTAQMINGTGGYVFHPKVSRKENLTAFISELYRSGYFSYQRDIALHGIKLYEFSLPADELVNTTQDPGFYPNGPSGVLNLTAVTPNAIALFASKPHFLDADRDFLANVSGLRPNRALHDSYLAVEPITGAVLSAAKRIQISLHLQSYKDLPELKNLKPELMLPIFWASEDGNITTSLANEFKSAVYSVEYGISGGMLAAIVLAGESLSVSVCPSVSPPPPSPQVWCVW